MLPYLQEVQSASKKYSVVFRGINYGEGTQDGEFAETYNLSTDQYPCITQRAARVEAGKYTNPTTLHSKGQLLVINDVDDQKAEVYYGGKKIEDAELTAGKKQTATIGNYIVIFPDKKYYKVPTEKEPDGEFGNMEVEYKATGLSFESSAISRKMEYKASGLEFRLNYIAKENADFLAFFRPGDAVTITGCNNPKNNKTTEVVINQVYSEVLKFDDDIFGNNITESGEVTITRIAKGDFPFSKGDSVTITGCSKDENNKPETSELIIRGVTGDTLTFDSNSFTKTLEQGEVTIKRSVPDLDFICESNYRLWGTHGNTIYSSKYSDPINFKSYEGLAGDSYYIDVGSEGEFTGCIPYSSHICFFKENTLHKLYGTKPSNFQVTTATVYGVQSGSEKSMQIVNEQLLYKGVGGVYSYTGGVPELISEKFGNKMYSEAVACCDGEKYYISMKQGNESHLFAYDVLKNIWLREDDTQAVDMTFYDGKVYFLDARGSLYYIDQTADRGDIEWERHSALCTKR